MAKIVFFGDFGQRPGYSWFLGTFKRPNLIFAILMTFKAAKLTKKPLKVPKNTVYLYMQIMTSLRDPLLGNTLKVSYSEIAAHSTFWKDPKLSFKPSTLSAQKVPIFGHF